MITSISQCPASVRDGGLPLLAKLLFVINRNALDDRRAGKMLVEVPEYQGLVEYEHELELDPK